MREHGKKFQKESIILIIKQHIFEFTLKKLELAVTSFFFYYRYIFILVSYNKFVNF